MSTAALLAAEAPPPGSGNSPTIEDTFTIPPEPWRTMTSPAARIPLRTPTTFTRIISAARTGSASWRVPKAPTPALLTITSSRPPHPTARRTSACTWSQLETSHWTARPSSSAASDSNRSTRRAATTTRAPRSRRARAVATPMPAEAPVTTATAPSSETRAPRSPGTSPLAIVNSVAALGGLRLRRDHDGRRARDRPEDAVEERSRRREPEEALVQQEEPDDEDRERKQNLDRAGEALPGQDQPRRRATAAHRWPAPVRTPIAPRPPTTAPGRR